MNARRSTPPSSQNVPAVEAGAPGKQAPVEYKVLTEIPAQLEAELNRLGADGWQLVATVPSFIFRRPLIEPSDSFRGRVGFTSPRD